MEFSYPEEVVRARTAERAALTKERDELRAENKRLRAALEFYADLQNWPYDDEHPYPGPGCYSGTPIDNDEGDIARKALEE